MNRPEQNTRRTLLANSAYIFLIRFFPALASMLGMVLLLRYTDAATYGNYQHFWVHWQIYNAVACIGLPALLLTYSWERINRAVGHISSRSMLLFAGWLLLTGVIFAATQFPGFSSFYTWFSFLFLLINAAIAIMEAYLMTGKRFAFIFTLSACYALVFSTAHWLFIKQLILFHELFFYLLAGSLVRLFLLLAKSIQLYNTSRFTDAGMTGLANIRHLWMHLAAYDIIQTTFRWADKFILSFIISTELFAVYFNGTFDIPFLALMLGAVGSALLMRLSETGITDAERVHLLRQSAAKLSLIVFPLFFFMILFRHELFSVIFANKYPASVTLFFISGLVIPLRCYNFTSILQHKGKGTVINAGALLDLALAIVLMYPLYLLWGLNGIALAFVISTYFQASFYLWHTAKLMHCRVWSLLPLRSWLINGVIFLISFAVLYLTLHHFFTPFYTLLWGGTVTLLVMFVSLVPTLLLKRGQYGRQA